MAVFRIEKTRDYTVMSNHHLKDRTLTLKSKGLLSMMLSLPDEWNYTTRGLAAICREGVDSIGAALKELETHGYIRRTQLRDEKGKITDTEYVIYEMPQCEPPSSPGTPLPGTAKPYTENPDMGIPDTADPCTENPAQLNTNQTKTDLSSTEISNPIQSNPPTPAGARMGTDRMGARECYREVILDTWLIVGWLAVLVVLPLLMSYGIMPLMPLTYSKFSPYFFINVLYSYVRLALVNVLLVRTLAIWRVKREAKKANRNATET